MEPSCSAGTAARAPRAHAPLDEVDLSPAAHEARRRGRGHAGWRGQSRECETRGHPSTPSTPAEARALALAWPWRGDSAHHCCRPSSFILEQSMRYTGMQERVTTRRALQPRTALAWGKALLPWAVPANETCLGRKKKCSRFPTVRTRRRANPLPLNRQRVFRPETSQDD